MASSAGFEQLAARFLSQRERQGAYSGQCGLLKMRIDQQAQQLELVEESSGEVNAGGLEGRSE